MREYKLLLLKYHEFSVVCKFSSYWQSLTDVRKIAELEKRHFDRYIYITHNIIWPSVDLKLRELYYIAFHYIHVEWAFCILVEITAFNYSRDIRISDHEGHLSRPLTLSLSWYIHSDISISILIYPCVTSPPPSHDYVNRESAPLWVFSLHEYLCPFRLHRLH